jgi:hypothetical protein
VLSDRAMRLYDQTLPFLVSTLIVCISTVYPALGDEPKVRVIPPKSPPHVNQPFELTYEISWSGGPEEFSILPLEFEPVTWAELEAGPIRSGVWEGKNSVFHTLRIIPKVSGKFEVPPVKIGYLIPGVSSAASTESNAGHQHAHPAAEDQEQGPSYPTLRAAAVPMQVRPASRLSWYLAGGGGLILVLGGLFWALYANRRVPAGAPAGPPRIDIGGAQAALHTAKHHRLDGKYYEFYRSLVHAVRLVQGGNAAEALRARLEAQANEVGYKGLRPTDDAMDGAQKDVDRLIRDAHAGERIRV